MISISRFFRRFRVIFHNLKRVISDPERKNLAQMCWEFIRCSVVNRCIAVHYITSLLYRRNVHNIFDYISRKEEKKVQDKINDPSLSDLISNKLSFVDYFERGGFPVPRLLGYNVLDKLYMKIDDRWEVTELSSPIMLKKSFTHLMASWGITEVFLKPIRGSQGLGADKITLDQLHAPHAIERLHSNICQNSNVIQQVVEQHPELSRLNPGVLNTMRIDTFRASGAQAEILSAFLRVGGKGNNVDNVSAGGVFVGIHLETGKLKEKALNFFHGSQSFGTFIANPANGVLFDGFLVPLFDEVKETVIRAAEYIPSALVGWDVAVGPSGPVLIEANCLYYGVISSDIAYGGYKKNPVYQKVLAYANMR